MYNKPEICLYRPIDRQPCIVSNLVEAMLVYRVYKQGVEARFFKHILLDHFFNKGQI